MQDVKIASAQFTPKDVDKEANLAKIAELTGKAASAGAEIVCFQEQAIAGYNLWGLGSSNQRAGGGKVVEPGRVSPAWKLPGAHPYDVAEPVPDGPSTQKLIGLARQHNVILAAGLPEVRRDNAVYNTYVIVSRDGLLGKYSKCHCVPGLEFAYFKQGNSLPVFELGKIRAGVLICYDNHFPEAHRVLAIQGAHAILMPHVTVGRGWWHDLPPEQAHQQARNWILTWLRARAFDNSVFAVFVNQAGQGEQGTLGCSMILDPEGDVIAECASTGEDFVVAELSAKKYYDVRRRTHDYLSHRRPELYGPLTRIDMAES